MRTDDRSGSTHPSTFFIPEQQRRFESDLRDDLGFVDAILRELPPVREPERILIRTDVASVDRAIARAVVMAVAGIETRIELLEEKDAS